MLECATVSALEYNVSPTEDDALHDFVFKEK